ncbi:hypothetical protein Rhe02_61100 [Rhizocola hellebori]|uniref:Uncharacterized protein n=1 Tax=Rhizocola hellebori TaxID=1392758 RepID=A0A8J3QC00_9ACTN|nr:hypothetical protein Rhe02_61100 [Rhizocola hellebori]
MVTLPELGRRLPAMARNRVVFPAPELPVTASNSPARATTEMSRRTALSDVYPTVMCSTASVADIDPSRARAIAASLIAAI